MDWNDIIRMYSEEKAYINEYMARKVSRQYLLDVLEQRKGEGYWQARQR
jgi:hypothetical protein